MGLSDIIGMFAAILIGSAVLLYVGIIGLKSDKKQDQLNKENEPQK
jgi:hypothetical protein